VEKVAPVLRLAGVTRRFGDTPAVDALTLEVTAGEYFCIVGPSGSGKSTLLRLVAGFEHPDRGEVWLAGRRADGVAPERREVNTVFQGYALFPHLSVFENVAFGLRMKKRPLEEIRGRVPEMLALVGLAGFEGRRPHSLSGGEQQRVALARALVNRPALLLLDEPLAALDRKLRLRMQEELARIQKETGITFIHVTHDQEEALRLADRLAVMDRGRLLQVGTPASVYHRPETAFVAGFLGSANLIPATALGSEPPAVALPGGTTLTLASGERLPPEGRSVTVVVRPEALRVEEGDAAASLPPSAPVNRLSGVVESRTSLGAVEELRLRLGGGPSLLVHAHTSPGRPLPSPGDPLTVTLHPGDVVPLAPEGTE